MIASLMKQTISESISTCYTEEHLRLYSGCQSRPQKLLQGLSPNIASLVRIHSRHISFLEPINRNHQLLTKPLILNPPYRVRISMKSEDQSFRARKAM